MSYLVRLLALLALFNGAASAEPAKPEPSKIKALSFVALTEPKLPNAVQLRTSLQERLGNVKIDDMETDDKQVILFRVRGGTVTVGLLPRPLPKDEVDQVCKWAWYWRAACDAMAHHQAHLHVMVLDTDFDKVGAGVLQTKVIASLMDSNAIASYWGTSLQSRGCLP